MSLSSIDLNYNSDEPPYVFQDADKINLPDLKAEFALRQKDNDWIKAFAWYNKYHRLWQRKFTMNCRSCHVKVYNMLALAKGNPQKYIEQSINEYSNK